MAENTNKPNNINDPEYYEPQTTSNNPSSQPINPSKIYSSFNESPLSPSIKQQLPENPVTYIPPAGLRRPTPTRESSVHMDDSTAKNYKNIHHPEERTKQHPLYPHPQHYKPQYFEPTENTPTNIPQNPYPASSSNEYKSNPIPTSNNHNTDGYSSSSSRIPTNSIPQETIIDAKTTNTTNPTEYNYTQQNMPINQPENSSMYSESPVLSNVPIKGEPYSGTSVPSKRPLTWKQTGTPSSHSSISKNKNPNPISDTGAVRRDTDEEVAPTNLPKKLKSFHVSQPVRSPATSTKHVEEGEVETHDAEGKPVNVRDALSYLDLVKYQFQHRPEVYNQFLGIMKDFKSNEIDTPGVIERVSTLFRGHSNLVQGFNTFLPPGYLIECSDNPYEPVRVTTPSGNVRQTKPYESNKSQSIPSGQLPPPQVAKYGDEEYGPNPAYYNPQTAVPKYQAQPQPQIPSQMHPLPQLPPLQAHSHTPVSHPVPNKNIPIEDLNEKTKSISSRDGIEPQNSPYGSNSRQAAVHPTKQQPLEFNHAISFVNKIKMRFASETERYSEFLEILQAYQRDSGPIQQVYDKMSVLFASAPDLLEEFKQFLPEEPDMPQQSKSDQNSLYFIQGRNAEHIPMSQIPKNSDTLNVEAGGNRLPPVGSFTSNSNGIYTGHLPTAPGLHQSDALIGSVKSSLVPESPIHKAPGSRKKRLTSGHVGDPLGNRRRLKGEEIIMKEKESDVTEVVYGGSSDTADEYVFFEKVKRYIGKASTYNEFIKLLNLYNQGILDEQGLVERAEPFIESDPELFIWFKNFVGPNRASSKLSLEHDDFSESSIERPFAAPLEPYKPTVTHPPPEQDNADPKLFEKSTKSYGPSYRLRPRAEVNLVCTGRDPMCWEVLNDSWFSHPTWESEESAFVQHKKNAYEDALFKCEEERHEFDINIETNLSLIRTLNSIAHQLDSMSEQEKEKLQLPLGLGGYSEALPKMALRKVYDPQRSSEILEALHTHPAIAVPVVLKRLKQKDEEWRKQRREMLKVWREIDAKNFYKSLDHQSLTFKANDRKALSLKQLTSEIENIRSEQIKTKNATKEPITGLKHRYQLGYNFDTGHIISDIINLLLIHVNRQNSFFFPNEKPEVEKFFIKIFGEFMGLGKSIGIKKGSDLGEAESYDSIEDVYSNEYDNTGGSKISMKSPINKQDTSPKNEIDHLKDNESIIKDSESTKNVSNEDVDQKPDSSSMDVDENTSKISELTNGEQKVVDNVNTAEDHPEKEIKQEQTLVSPLENNVVIKNESIDENIDQGVLPKSDTDQKTGENSIDVITSESNEQKAENTNVDDTKNESTKDIKSSDENPENLGGKEKNSALGTDDGISMDLDNDLPLPPKLGAACTEKTDKYVKTKIMAPVKLSKVSSMSWLNSGIHVKSTINTNTGLSFSKNMSNDPGLDLKRKSIRNTETPLDKNIESENKGASVLDSHLSSNLSETTDEQKEGSKKHVESRVFYCNSTIYMFLRLFQVLYSRFDTIKKVSHEAQERMKYKETSKSVAVQLNMRTIPSSLVDYDLCNTDYYSLMLDLIEKQINNQLDSNAFEDSIRFLFGTSAYLLLTVDRLFSTLSKQLQSIISDSKCCDLVSLFEELNVTNCSNLRDYISYRIRAQQIIGISEFVYRFDYIYPNQLLTIQLLKQNDSTLDTNVSMEDKWAYYVDSYILFEPTEGVPNPRPKNPKDDGAKVGFGTGISGLKKQAHSSTDTAFIDTEMSSSEETAQGQTLLSVDEKKGDSSVSKEILVSNEKVKSLTDRARRDYPLIPYLERNLRSSSYEEKKYFVFSNSNLEIKISMNDYKLCFLTNSEDTYINLSRRRDFCVKDDYKEACAKAKNESKTNWQKFLDEKLSQEYPDGVPEADELK
ncbi:hypothetical protein BB558_001036 [Smittium angustum]|uniref:Histone deacetylase interacting domain-containing protein n=1 Tax=Smittium angustum TaxID=133377 RepID=A0A2U1JCI5_SMIAN|nr:hypothetical protein BB558_001036 [Smittium angustum]